MKSSSSSKRDTISALRCTSRLERERGGGGRERGREGERGGGKRGREGGGGGGQSVKVRLYMY